MKKTNTFGHSKRAFAVLSWLMAAFFLLPMLAAGMDFQVVVHDSNTKDSVKRNELSRIFMKTLSRWEDGSTIKPADQGDESSVRGAFSQQIHKRSTDAIENHWVKMVFSGRDTPPPKFAADDEILEFVRANRSAIGYVSAEASLGDGLRALPIVD